MQWTGLNEIREKYLSFFESKGHIRLPSYPLIPQNDKSLLLINSGMAPMKKFFTGEEEPPRRRVTTCQKCIRTPDLERVGHTARHGTYFEMLGNFSFGDYFKNEAIAWAWEFLTETLGIPGELLWPSVYVDDDETFEIWNKVIGVPAEKITKLGKADNFWEHGSGPCGPCSEIYFDRGEKYGCGSPDCRPGCDCDRYMEIWNNVFSQFNNDGNGNYTELVQKNIDTGMGLERLACVMQGVDNLFEVDTVRKILDTVCEISGKKYGDSDKDDVSIRVITDHIRSATFMICDGVIPSNEGRGYVLRRILRRAARHGKLLGISRKFLPELCEVVIGQNIDAYPELGDKRDYILKVISLEEERFYVTIDAGLSMLSNIVRDCLKSNGSVISGDAVFKLYDTYGFPIDLTREILSEQNLSVDEETFSTLMQQQRERARSARGNISGWTDASKNLVSNLPKTDFTGYTEYSSDAKVLAVITDEESVDEISEGDFSLILDRTPFYGEGGGQVGDTGTITAGGLLVNVTDVKKTDGVYIHVCHLAEGVLRVGDTVRAVINSANRDAIKRNHSACHLLQAALRTVLGTHVEQAGSYVDNERARFDFTHFAALTPEELNKVEGMVNAYILLGEAVTTLETDMETAKQNGAMALFGEKYGKVVRMVKMGNFSTELCGGTHVENTGRIGLFKIVSETSVAAGVRRIEGVTGIGVLKLIQDKQNLIDETAGILKVQNSADMSKRASQLMSELKDAKREIESLDAKLASVKMKSLLENTEQVGSVKLLVADLGDASPDSVRTLADSIKADRADTVAVLGTRSGEKVNFVAVCGADAVKCGAHAGNIVREVAKIAQGGGGGRPDSATAGGRDASKMKDALAAAKDVLLSMLK